MDTEEMYRRGVADAEQGDPHPFYYQHYYHYRRGYDQMRRKLHRPWIGHVQRAGRGRWLVFTIALLLIGFVAAPALRERIFPRSEDLARPSVADAAPTASPTRRPIFPTATPLPTNTSLMLNVGRAVVVSNTDGKPLLGRKAPNRKAAISAAFQEGDQLHVLEGPVQADGYTWWRVEGKNGSGWSAERSTDGLVWLKPAE